MTRRPIRRAVQLTCHLARTQTLGLLALLLVLTGGTAYAAVAAKDSVVSRSIKNGQVKTPDLADSSVGTRKLKPNAVTGAKVAPDTLTGDDLAADTLTGSDIEEGSLGTVPDATTVGGVGPGAFVRSTVYKKVSPQGDGTLLMDGTRTQALACDAGDLLLNGGPGGIAPQTNVLESTPSGGDLTVTNSWTVRVNTFGGVDPYSVIIICADQA